MSDHDTEYSVEIVIRMVAPKPWKKTTVEIVRRVFTDHTRMLAHTAENFAAEWTRHGEPVVSEVEFREIKRPSRGTFG